MVASGQGLPVRTTIAKDEESEQSWFEGVLPRTNTVGDLMYLTNDCKHCKHKAHCVIHCFQGGMLRGFAVGYGAAITANLGKIILKGSFKSLTMDLFREEFPINAGILFGSVGFVYRTCLCFLRRYLESDSKLLFGLAGYASGVCLFLLPKESRTTFALYMLVRAVADLYSRWKRIRKQRRQKKSNSPEHEFTYKRVLSHDSSDSPRTKETIELTSLAAASVGQDVCEQAETISLEIIENKKQNFSIATLKKYLSTFAFNVDIPSVLTFSSIQVPIMYCFVRVPEALNPGYLKWIMNMGNCWNYPPQVICAQVPFETNCEGLLHPGHSCVTAHVFDLYGAFFRAAKIYLPVHFVAPLIFSPARVIKDFGPYLLKASLRTLQSIAFISAYQFNEKMGICWGRWLLGDTDLVPILSGWCSGFSIILEHPSRRTELILYCLPKAIESLVNLLPKKSRSKRMFTSSLTTIFCFQLSLGIWMYLLAEEEVNKNKRALVLNSQNANDLVKVQKFKSSMNKLNKIALTVIFGHTFQ